MNWILAIPLEVRLAAVFLLGACLGGLVNLGVYRLAWNRRAICPWSAPAAEAPPRRWYDRLPILGWLGLRREAGLHGRGFWIRPMLVELLCGVGFAALYWWEIDRQGLVLAGLRPMRPEPLHAQFACHVVLIALMLAGSLIDLDEKIIPDAITVPGTLFGLLVAAVYPWSLLPDKLRVVGVGPLGNLLGPAPPPVPDFLRLTSPHPWPPWLDGFPHAWPLAIGLGCWWLWCVALLERKWYSRFGWLRAFRYFVAGLLRSPSTGRILLMGSVGTAVIALVWFPGGPHWAGLLTSLVGVVASGGIIWAIRIVGGAVLRREAMGFGDVTLMAMIGSFLGWQPCMMIFFLAPFAAIAFGILSLILRRGPEIPYGPFLCLLAVLVIVRWAAFWERAAPIFALGWLLVVILLICLLLMVPLLFMTRMIRAAFGH